MEYDSWRAEQTTVMSMSASTRASSHQPGSKILHQPEKILQYINRTVFGISRSKFCINRSKYSNTLTGPYSASLEANSALIGTISTSIRPEQILHQLEPFLWWTNLNKFNIENRLNNTWTRANSTSTMTNPIVDQPKQIVHLCILD
jgi:hypothetical protein